MVIGQEDLKAINEATGKWLGVILNDEKGSHETLYGIYKDLQNVIPSLKTHEETNVVLKASEILRQHLSATSTEQLSRKKMPDDLTRWGDEWATNAVLTLQDLHEEADRYSRTRRSWSCPGPRQAGRHR